MTLDPVTYLARMQQRWAPPADWDEENPELLIGELGFSWDEEENDLRLKVGRGLAWSETPYWGAGEGGGPVDLSYDPATRFLDSSTGNGVTLPLADIENAGLLPTLADDADVFLDGSGEWTAPLGQCDLAYNAVTRALSSSTGEGITLPLVGTVVEGAPVAGLQTPEEAARLAETGSPQFAGLTVTGTSLLTHIHGNLAGSLYHHVKNDSGVSLAVLTPYRIINTQGATERVLIVAARADDPALMPASGITSAALAANEDGHGVIAGEILGLNTASLASGVPLYVATAGGLTATAPASRAQVVAIVGRSHATTGSIIVQVGTVRPTAAEVGADPSGTAASAVAAHLLVAPHLDAATVAGLAPVQSVALAVPSGWGASSANVSGNVTLTLTLPVGSSLVSTGDRSAWDQGYGERLRWDGGSTGLNAATARTSLGLGSAAQADVSTLQPRTIEIVNVAYAATVNLDFEAYCGKTVVVGTLTGNLQITFSNVSAGRLVAVHLTCDATQRNLTFPSAAPFFGTKPSSIAASKQMRLSFECLGSTEASVNCGAASQG